MTDARPTYTEQERPDDEAWKRLKDALIARGAWDAEVARLIGDFETAVRKVRQ